MLGADNTAAQRLRLLKTEFTQHVRSGPGDGRSATLTTGAAPLDLGTLDYMAHVVAEVEGHTRAAAPHAGPFAGPQVDVYDWAREHTAHLADKHQQDREVLFYRQGLEHAIAMGDTSVIRKHACPECGCWGMYWRAAAGQAVCVNHYCTDSNGVAHAWSLAQIARHHIESKESSARRAT